MSGALPLFVYGASMTGHERSPLLGALGRRLGTVRGTLWSMPAGYPALVPGGDGLVHGELIDPPDERLLGLLDGLEGVDQGLYRRIRCDVRIGLRAEVAWAYAMDAAWARTGRRIPDGRWRPSRRR
ncbi:MAG: gamma-glutamylcyclotransferase family protein [Myxococcota bacterium]